MKKTVALVTFLYLHFFLFSQANKPDVGDFGIRTGLYVSTVNQGPNIFLSKNLKKNLECGIGISAVFNGSNHTTNDTITLYTLGTSLSAKSETVNKSLNYTVSLSPFLIYHFPLKNNFDVYAGGWLVAYLANTVLIENSLHVIADNYERKTFTKISYPFSFGTGAGFLLGTEYYFHKNMAIGLQGNLGFSSSFQYGKQITTTSTSNSGSLNSSQQNIETEKAINIKNIDGNVSLRGGVGFNLTFFFTRKEKKKDAEKN